MKKKAVIMVRIIFALRIVLWAVALASTIYWIRYSFVLYQRGIVLPEEYSPLLRPVLYTCVLIAALAIAASFGLYAISSRIKKKNGL